MRRMLKAVIQDRNPGDITTIEDEGSVEEAKQAWHHMKAELEAQAAVGAAEGRFKAL
jgi:acetyl-CoA synthetase